MASRTEALHLPVNGVRIREFGGPDGVGGTQKKGLSIAARAGGEITGALRRLGGLRQGVFAAMGNS